MDGDYPEGGRDIAVGNDGVIGDDWYASQQKARQGEDVSGGSGFNEGDSTDKAQAGESTFKNNVGGKRQKKNKFKTYGPLVGIGTGLAFIITLFSIVAPTILPFHIGEMLDQKFSSLSSVSSRRTRKIMTKKLTSSKNYGGMTNKTLLSFAKNDLQPLGTNGQPIAAGSDFKKVEVTGFNDLKTGKTYTSASFESALNSDPSLRNRVNRVYRGDIAAYYDTTAATNRKKNGLAGTTNGVIIDADNPDTSISERLSKQARGGVDADKVKTVDGGLERNEEDVTEVTNDDGTTTTKKDEFLTPDDSDTRHRFDGEDGKTALNKADSALNGMDNVPGLRDMVSRYRSNPTVLKAASTVSNVLSVFGIADGVCTIRQMLAIVSTGAKAIQAAQLMIFSASIRSEWDKAKAGDGDEKNMSDILNMFSKKTDYVLESGTSEEDSTEVRSEQKSGLESQMMKWVFGQSSITSLDPSASQYVTGSGWLSTIQTIENVFNIVVDTLLVGMSDEVCGFIKHPIVQGLALIGGVFIATVTFSAWQVFQAAFVFALGWAANTIILPNIIKMAAGTVIGVDISGQDATNASVIGDGTFESRLALTRGLNGLGEQEAISAYHYQQEYIAQIAEEEKIKKSPFDISSPYTFLGSIVVGMIPSMGSISIVNTLTTVGSMFNNSLRSILPTTSAEDLAEYKQSLKVSNDDQQLNSIGVAALPGYIPTVGISDKYIDSDPDDVINYLLEKGQIEEVDGEEGSVKEFDIVDSKSKDSLKVYQDRCTTGTNSSTPIGASYEENNTDDDKTGAICVTKDSDDLDTVERKSFYALFFIDRGIEEGIDGDALNSVSADFMETAYENRIAYYNPYADDNNDVYTADINNIDSVKSDNNSLKQLSDGAKDKYSSDPIIYKFLPVTTSINNTTVLSSTRSVFKKISIDCLVSSLCDYSWSYTARLNNLIGVS